MEKQGMGTQKKITIIHEEVVRFSEVDSYGIVHNVQYYNYFDIGRTYFVNMLFRRTRNYVPGHTIEPYYFLVLKSHCRYKHTSRLGDRLKIETTYQYCSNEKNALIRLEHVIKSVSPKRIIAEGETILGICNNNYELVYTMPEVLGNELQGSVEYYINNPVDIIKIKKKSSAK